VILNIFKEKDGKWSSTRVSGLTCIMAGVAGFIVSGLGFYTIDTLALSAILGTGVTLLTVKALKKKL